MKHFIIIFVFLIFSNAVFAFDYPTYSTTLTNGLKVIVCEKPSNSHVTVQVWYRVGSKDESDGIRGIAHMFEHMMFRGSKNFMGEGDVYIDSIESFGGEANAYTSYDRTVYYETVPSEKLLITLQMEADRMNNLVLSQDMLNTEREVVGEELRNGENNWFQRMNETVYDQLYPEGHPYRVDVIGYLDQILKFTTDQCQRFYDNFYSPNNAFIVLVGDVKKENAFDLAQKAFGGITEQLNVETKKNVPDIFSDSLRQYDFNVDFPVQIYGYMIPKPASNDPDFYKFLLLKDLLFTNSNSILNHKLVDEMKMVYGINEVSDEYSLYTNYDMLYLVMQAAPGNFKVKKTIAEEIQSIIDDGVEEETLNDFLSNLKATRIQSSYTDDYVAGELGMAEYYLHDFNRSDEMEKQFSQITSEDLQATAKKYFDPAKLQVVNIKPAF